MSEYITEALLEMAFFHSLVDLFRSVFGGDLVKVFKPSPQLETWVGFDQGWVKTTSTSENLLNELRQSIHNNEDSVNSFYFGFFMQYKVVDFIERSSKYKPPHYNVPYYRSKLSLEPNMKTGYSQHETLLRLRAVTNSSVCYACPMVFTQSDIFNPDLSMLKLVDISTSPEGWATNTDHFITFQTVDDHAPYWCSTPVRGRAYNVNEWLRSNNQGRINDMKPKKLDAREAYNLIRDCSNALSPESFDIWSNYIGDIPGLIRREVRFHDDPVFTIPQSFTLMEFLSQ